MNYSINWDEQWALHSPHFKNGKVELKIGNKTLYLKPGPGFGDLSHPTTRLMVKNMAEWVKGKRVLDIGSGCGILSIASLLLGAKEVIGIDIDKEANQHAKENAELNQFNISFLTPDQYQGCPEMILMNMISSEQEQAFEQLPLKHYKGPILTSGVLKEQKKEYLNLRKKWNLIKIFEEEGWLALLFTI